MKRAVGDKRSTIGEIPCGQVLIRAALLGLAPALAVAETLFVEVPDAEKDFRVMKSVSLTLRRVYS